MKKHAKLIELTSQKESFQGLAEVHAAGKAGFEIIMENSLSGGREIWKVFRDSCLIDSMYENSIRIIVRKDRPVRILISTEFGDLETEAELVRYEFSNEDHHLHVILEYLISESDESIGFELWTDLHQNSDENSQCA